MRLLIYPNAAGINCHAAPDERNKKPHLYLRNGVYSSIKTPLLGVDSKKTFISEL
jgi:hypothetical protein